jgi:5-methylcytosine-specific restriction endonuclease McrA
MKNTKVNAAQVWKQFEDLLAPKLNFSRTDRAIYSHLFRHSRLEGKLQFRFSIAWLARGVSLSMKATRGSVRRLVARGVLGLVERNCRSQHVVRVRLPLEVKGVRTPRKTSLPPAHPAFAKIEEADFMEKQVLRASLHEREGGHCFYCLRRSPGDRKCLDHVVPQAQGGGNSYRNLVSCCVDCNSQKGEQTAEEYLRWLFRGRRLSDAELGGRLRALDDLAAGKLIPPLPGQGDAGSDGSKGKGVRE